MIKIPLLARIGALIVATTAFYTYVGQMVPQKEVQPPEEIALRTDMTTAEMVTIGQQIMNGKGMCFTCHTIGKKAGPFRFPDLDGVDTRAKTRVPGLSDIEYFAQSMYEPDRFIVPGFNPGMPTINKPPIGLTDQEILCVIAYLQSLGGTPTVTLQTKHHYTSGTAAAAAGAAPAAEAPASGAAAAAAPPSAANMGGAAAGAPGAAASTGAAGSSTGETALSDDLSTEAMVKVGQDIVAGKGLCLTCHTMGKRGKLDFPDFKDVDVRAKRREPGMSDVEYFAQSMYEPDAFIAPGFEPGMPAINEPPVGLSDREILCVIAYLQSLGGRPTVTMHTKHRYNGGRSAIPARPPTSMAAVSGGTTPPTRTAPPPAAPTSTTQPGATPR